MQCLGYTQWDGMTWTGLGAVSEPWEGKALRKCMAERDMHRAGSPGWGTRETEAGTVGGVIRKMGKRGQ